MEVYCPECGLMVAIGDIKRHGHGLSLSLPAEWVQRKKQRPMMTHDELIGTHEPTDGNGLTIQELIDLLKTVPREARSNYVMVEGPTHFPTHFLDVTGIEFAQSDQAEKWEFKVYIKGR